MSDLPTPETDAAERLYSTIDDQGEIVSSAHVVPLDFARSLERRLTTMTRERDEWHLAAVKGACYRADSPHATPEEWLKSQTDAALALISERDKARAMVSVAREALVFIGDRHPDGNPIYSIKSAEDALARIDQIGKDGAK